MIIQGGTSGKFADVNDENELVVRAINESELEHSSAKNGKGFSWVSTDTDINAGDTRLFIKNNSSTTLILDRGIFLPANVDCDWSIRLGKATTAVADSIAYDDETAVADGTPIDWAHSETAGTIQKSLDGIVLRKGHYIQVNQETESTSGRVVIIGHFENPN
jgi:hypothetical protein